MAREQLKTLTQQMYYILLVLQNENFGYQIMQDVEQLTKGRVLIGAGTVYALLSRFENEGIIKQINEIDRKKYYQLTKKGYQLLKEEYLRLKCLVEDGISLEEDI